MIRVRGARLPPLVPAALLAALIGGPASYAAEEPVDIAMRTLMTCMRSTAARIEPSGDPPRDVATAAMFVCQPEESEVLRAPARRNGATMLPKELRATALYYGSAQAVLSRLCRKLGDCKMAPAPAYLQRR